MRTETVPSLQCTTPPATQSMIIPSPLSISRFESHPRNHCPTWKAVATMTTLQSLYPTVPSLRVESECGQASQAPRVWTPASRHAHRSLRSVQATTRDETVITFSNQSVSPIFEESTCSSDIV